MDNHIRQTMVHTRVQRSVRNDKIEQEKKMLLGYYDYTVILTYSGMLSAFIGILLSINVQFKAAVICLMISGLCDMFDGAVASTKVRTKNQKRFGIQIDSLSDLISFGLLPAMFVYTFAGKSTLSAVISSVYTLFALIRLSYFNVLEEERQSSTNEKRTDYLGVPVTSAAMIIPFVYLAYKANVFSDMLLFPLILLVLGIFFITAVKIKKPQKTGKIIMLIIGVIEFTGIILV